MKHKFITEIIKKDSSIKKVTDEDIRGILDSHIEKIEGVILGEDNVSLGTMIAYKGGRAFLVDLIEIE